MNNIIISDKIEHEILNLLKEKIDNEISMTENKKEFVYEKDNKKFLWLKKLKTKTEIYFHKHDKNISEESVKNNKIFIRVSSIEDVENQLENIKLSFDKSLTQDTFTFGCCGFYVQCSDARHCINNNKIMRSGCLYRKNLENGKIFYGKNKNI